MKDLENKSAVVTGGGSGIGRAVAVLYAKEGASVVVSDINEEGGQETVSLIRAEGGKAVFVKADVSKPDDNRLLTEEAVRHYGGLDISCNNAGIGGPLAATGEYPIEGWDKVISINLSGVFYGMRYQIPAMLKSGGGTIVNMTSILGTVGIRNSAAYVAAKHGIVGLTKSAALEYAGRNIRINSVGPGFIKTPLITDTLSPAALDGITVLHPIGRLGTPEEVAELVLWLSSSKSSFVTGSYYVIDGGYTAQ
jgi:NAD(P)-dependent dehydrogenase (short-subunit alcohol dehydrogenase family)